MMEIEVVVHKNVNYYLHLPLSKAHRTICINHIFTVQNNLLCCDLKQVSFLYSCETLKSLFSSNSLPSPCIFVSVKVSCLSFAPFSHLWDFFLWWCTVRDWERIVTPLAQYARKFKILSMFKPIILQLKYMGWFEVIWLSYKIKYRHMCLPAVERIYV